jgi:hypothetical protein
MERTPTIRKVPAESVSYGREISRQGKWVYVALDEDGTVIATAATAGQARRLYHKRWWDSLPGSTKAK